jgi:hypothetical protein
VKLRGHTTTWALVVAAAVAAACGSSKQGFGGNDGGGGGSSGGANDSGSFFNEAGTFGDGASSSSGGSSGGGMPVGCNAPVCQAAGGTCQNQVCVIVDNMAGASSTTQGQLQAGGNADPTFGWLYPYDQTVFPRGLLPPTMQFAGVVPDTFYVHITCDSLDYQGYFTPASGPPALALPAADWTAITDEASGPNDPLKVQITKISGGMVSGPITESWPVAQGSLRGVIYYETYGSTLIGGEGIGIMQIQPGATKPTIVKEGCGNVCHTASADGSTLVACVALDSSSASYDLKTSASKITSAAGNTFTYGGLYPDGSMEMSATNYRTWINAPSKLYNTATAANIPANGWDGVIKNAGTTAFSPDGQHIAFVHEDTSPNNIAMMDFDKSTTTFSNLRDLATAPQYAGWPAFTPDSKWVVYHSDTDSAFETDAMAAGDLFIVDTSSKATARLDTLDGYTAAGATTSYLPANDPGLNFAPTVLPEAVGGYFWIVFTSHRSYGNTLPSMYGPSGSPDQNGKLWVAALDLNPVDGHDASHPAFYLDGQEVDADCLRGFWVLPPCQQDGTACTSGDQCCNGFCRTDEAGAEVCVNPPGGCSNEYEKCTTSSDCCDTQDTCINNLCAQPAAQ